MYAVIDRPVTPRTPGSRGDRPSNGTPAPPPQTRAGGLVGNFTAAELAAWFSRVETRGTGWSHQAGALAGATGQAGISVEEVGMRYDEFIGVAGERPGLPRDDAEALTHAALRTLSERLNGGEAEDLRSQLPEGLRSTTYSARLAVIDSQG